MEAAACPWCGTPAHGGDAVQRLRVRKKRSVLRTYLEHIRRHRIYFILAIVVALLSAWFMIEFAQRSAKKPSPDPSCIITL